MVFSEEDKVLCQEKGYATQHPWSESSGLSCVERTGAAGVSHMHSRRQSPQDTSCWRVV